MDNFVGSSDTQYRRSLQEEKYFVTIITKRQFLSSSEVLESFGLGVME
jgi:hypothetical protein